MTNHTALTCSPRLRVSIAKAMADQQPDHYALDIIHDNGSFVTQLKGVRVLLAFMG